MGHDGSQGLLGRGAVLEGVGVRGAPPVGRGALARQPAEPVELRLGAELAPERVDHLRRGPDRPAGEVHEPARDAAAPRAPAGLRLPVGGDRAGAASDSASSSRRPTSKIRVSTVGEAWSGRRPQRMREASSIAPSPTRPRTAPSRSAQEPKRGGVPVRGIASNTESRQEASPPSRPRQNGEELDSASIKGRCPVIPAISATRASGSPGARMDAHAADGRAPRHPAHALDRLLAARGAGVVRLRPVAERVGGRGDRREPVLGRAPRHHHSAAGAGRAARRLRARAPVPTSIRHRRTSCSAWPSSSAAQASISAAGAAASAPVPRSTTKRSSSTPKVSAGPSCVVRLASATPPGPSSPATLRCKR